MFRFDTSALESRKAHASLRSRSQRRRICRSPTGEGRPVPRARAGRPLWILAVSAFLAADQNEMWCHFGKACLAAG